MGLGASTDRNLGHCRDEFGTEAVQYHTAHSLEKKDMTTFFAAVAGLATIAGAVYGIFKYIAWRLTPTAEQQKENTDADVQKEEDGFESTGRPQ